MCATACINTFGRFNSKSSFVARGSVFNHWILFFHTHLFVHCVVSFFLLLSCVLCSLFIWSSSSIHIHISNLLLKIISFINDPSYICCTFSEIQNQWNLITKRKGYRVEIFYYWNLIKKRKIKPSIWHQPVSTLDLILTHAIQASKYTWNFNAISLKSGWYIQTYLLKYSVNSHSKNSA